MENIANLTPLEKIVIVRNVFNLISAQKLILYGLINSHLKGIHYAA